MNDTIYVVTGPTASGKTALAVELAKRLNGEVVSADSMQIYYEMNIGTAKPTAEEQMGIVHHLIDIVRPNEAFSVADYQTQAFRCIRDIISRKKTPVLAGGTGLYINSITHKLEFPEEKFDIALREKLNKLDCELLYGMLKDLDNIAAERIHPNNKKRVIRAIEIAKQDDRTKKNYDFDNKNYDYDFKIIGLNCAERSELYDRINRRVDIMVEIGLYSEAKYLYEKYGEEQTSMQAIGYKELIRHFKNEISLDQAILDIKQNTRRFAKRQLTWFKRDSRIAWYDSNFGANTVADNILNNLDESEVI